jgi:hypothetical protein
MIALNRTQVVMPRLEEIVAGKYTSEQLSELAAHVANHRYGTKTKKDKTSSYAGRGRPRKIVEVAAPVKAASKAVTVKPKAVKPIPAKPVSKKPAPTKAKPIKATSNARAKKS